jgi:hypothetical protein
VTWLVVWLLALMAMALVPGNQQWLAASEDTPEIRYSHSMSNGVFHDADSGLSVVIRFLRPLATD